MKEENLKKLFKTLVCECQNCEKDFETEYIRPEEITCPYCHSGDVIIYEEEE